jgi:general secretion pathway protein A
MYCDFYQLTEPPFNVTPDPKFLYLNARYREAIASLNYGITQRKGFITLIGEAGTGKTTLLNKLLEEFDSKTKSVFIFNTNVTFEEILEYVFAEFGLPVHNGKKLYMLQRLNTFLLEELRGSGNVALLIDEAQDLEFSVLEDLRLLSNLETAKEKILQIVLSGQPELGQKLSNPVLRQLRQRIGINCRLLPLSRDEITEYIQYRLQAAGCPDLKLFSREAEDQIYHFSRGIPRLVNVVCDNGLVIGYALGKKRIGADVITEAAADLLSVESPSVDVHTRPVEVAAPTPPAAPHSRWRARLGVMAVVVVAMVVGLLSVGRTLLSKPDAVHVAPPAEAPKLEVIRPGSEPQGTGVGIAAARLASNDANAPAEPEQRMPADSVALLGAPVTDGGAAAADRPPPAPAGATGARPQDVAAAENAAHEATAEGRFGAPGEAPRGNMGAATTSAAVERPGALRAPEVQAPVAPAAAPPAAKAPALAVGAPVALPVANADVAMVPSANAEITGRAHHPAEEQRRASAEFEAPGEGRDADSRVEDGGEAPHLDGMHFAQVMVHGGDSVSTVALRKYGQATYTILDLLKLANPGLHDIDVISTGQTLRLPELSEGFPILNDSVGHYGLLVYSTPQAQRATALQHALRSHGFEAYVSEGNLGPQRPVFRVVVSGFGGRDEGAAVGQRLQKLFREDTRIAQLGE